MKNLEKGQDKIQKICDSIRKETLEPLKQEARSILEHAHAQAAEIVKQARAEAEKARAQAAQEIEEKQRLFHASLQLASRQGIEMLKQRIEQHLFNPELAQLVAKETAKPELIARLVEGFVKSLEVKGVDEDFEVVIPKEITPRMVNGLLAHKILERLKNHSVDVGDFHGGVKIKLQGQHVVIDISDAALKDLLALYIRRDFRDLMFQE